MCVHAPMHMQACAGACAHMYVCVRLCLGMCARMKDGDIILSFAQLISTSSCAHTQPPIIVLWAYFHGESEIMPTSWHLTLNMKIAHISIIGTYLGGNPPNPHHLNAR